ncbi:hypothetical protein RND71_019657 [Anisodus tanguticus]|uniref:Uncharacterized protein n=1 Tax=Anisodus tanguticus TaxID=243964 RepID=A0AAE1RZQ3_9SOLA|nr:hypothetical protein RND71_019657 [Anisodus tanguticus]
MCITQVGPQVWRAVACLQHFAQEAKVDFTLDHLIRLYSQCNFRDGVINLHHLGSKAILASLDDNCDRGSMERFIIVETANILPPDNNRPILERWNRHPKATTMCPSIQADRGLIHCEPQKQHVFCEVVLKMKKMVWKPPSLISVSHVTPGTMHIKPEVKKGLPPGTMGWPIFGETTQFLKQEKRKGRRILLITMMLSYAIHTGYPQSKDSGPGWTFNTHDIKCSDVGEGICSNNIQPERPYEPDGVGGGIRSNKFNKSHMSQIVSEVSPTQNHRPRGYNKKVAHV